MKIDLDPRWIDGITVANLTQIKGYFDGYLKDERPLVFHNDPVKDKKEIKRHRDAFNLIIKYLKEP